MSISREVRNMYLMIAVDLNWHNASLRYAEMRSKRAWECLTHDFTSACYLSPNIENTAGGHHDGAQWSFPSVFKRTMWFCDFFLSLLFSPFFFFFSTRFRAVVLQFRKSMVILVIGILLDLFIYSFVVIRQQFHRLKESWKFGIARSLLCTNILSLVLRAWF